MERRKYDEDYERFWKKFKGRWDGDKGCYVKVGKYLGSQEWKRLADYEKELAIAVAHRTGGRYTQDVCRWLRDKKFDDY